MSSLSQKQIVVGVAAVVAVVGLGAWFLSSRRKQAPSDDEAKRGEESDDAPVMMKRVNNPRLTLYSYDHCPFCAKVKMVLGYKNIEYDNVVLLNDDEDTPKRYVDAKVVPIIKKIDGSYMKESLDIVKYVDERYPGPRIGNAPTSPSIERWLSDTDDDTRRLVYPRYVLPSVNFAEFATPSAIKYFQDKREESLKTTFGALLENTAVYQTRLEAALVELASFIPGDGKRFLIDRELLTFGDIHLYSRLRSISIVKGIKWPPKVRAYIDFVAEKTRLPLFERRAA
eukprot:TRINITY_DN23438_c0_g2_i1.p2 TRINITY_DN23438_c0_g2~~TRINITY_DN23438_c0_g2_i1.p2  ORF type:complete len:284 (+),score=85.98 TRINITY_DN23438_c0_g2_i1:1655-2506(+)